MKRFTTSCLVLLAVLATTAQAVTIETVPVGNLGNAGELSGAGVGGYGPDRICGAVDYTYNIGKYEVTAGQYAEFLNAVAATDPYGLYNSNMDTIRQGCQITQHGTSGSYTYDFSGGADDAPGSTAADWENRPVNYVSWGDAARFANWLHNDRPTGTLTGNPVQDAGLTEDGAYDLNGAMSDVALIAVTREADWKWSIPNEDEWYKAAYYDPNKLGGAGYWDYPTKSDDPDVPSNDLDIGGNNATFYDGGHTIGSPYYRTEVGAHELSESPYGTFDQGGNVWEWNDAIISGSFRGLRGGSFDMFSAYGSLWAADRGYFYYTPEREYNYVGFRVAQVPEPTTITLLLCGLAGVLAWARRQPRPA